MFKTAFLLIGLGLALTHCSKNGNSTQVQAPATDKIDTSSEKVKFMGTFVSVPNESVSGTALILLKGSVYYFDNQ